MKPLPILTFPYTVYTDGAARGRVNGLGPSSAAFVVKDREGKRVYAAAKALGPHTNNFAEYQALILALDWVLDSVDPELWYVNIKSDSQLMVRQVTGVYQINDHNLKCMHYQAMMRLVLLDGWKLEHVRREFNTEADEMANRVLDAEKLDGTTFVEESNAKTD